MSDDRTSGSPRKLKDTINDDSEIRTFEAFKLVRSDTFQGALTVQSEFERDRGEWRIPQSSQLDGVLSQFQDSQEDRTASWEDVLDRIERSREEYEAKASRSSTRGRARTSEEAARVLASITDMIPDEKGLSVLRCGLSLVFRAWVNRLKNVQQIMSLLEDIPSELVNTHENWKCYPNDRRLQVHVMDYFKTALSSLTQLLAILLKEDSKGRVGPKKGSYSIPDKYRKAAAKVKDVGRQVFLDADTEQIQKITSELRDAKSTLDEWLCVLDRRCLVGTSRRDQVVETEVKSMRQVLFEIRAEMKRAETKRAIDQNRYFSDEYAVQELIEDAAERGAQRGAIALIQQMFWASRRGDRGLMNIPRFWAESIQTGFYELVSEDSYKRQELEWSPLQSRRPNGTTTQNPMLWGPNAANPHSVSVSVKELLDILGVDPQTSIKDEESTLRQGKLMQPAAVSHTSGLMTEHAFKTWLLTSTSSSLFINGHCRDMSNRAASPVSVFCASLAAALGKSPGLIVLDYFCARHARLSGNASDTTQGPRALIASLISQLLVYPDLPKPPLDFMSPDLLNGLETHSPFALCQVFQELLLRMGPGKTVFCIVDGVSDFEISAHGWDAEIASIHRRLLDMVCWPPLRLLSLKLLFTTPGQSRLLSRDGMSQRINLSARQIPSNPSPWRGRTFEQDVHGLLPTTSSDGGMSLWSPRSSQLPLRSSSSESRPGHATRGAWRSGSLEPGGM